MPPCPYPIIWRYGLRGYALLLPRTDSDCRPVRWPLLFGRFGFGVYTGVVYLLCGNLRLASAVGFVSGIVPNWHVIVQIGGVPDRIIVDRVG